MTKSVFFFSWIDFIVWGLTYGNEMCLEEDFEGKLFVLRQQLE